MRYIELKRETKETFVLVKLDLDNNGDSTNDRERKINTGIPFFDHMLEAFSFHGGFHLEVEAKGDLAVDYHHTVEDVGIVLGKAFNQALGEKKGIKRFANAYVPMDDALAQVVVDISNRPYLAYRVNFNSATIGNFSTELIQEFLDKFAMEARITLHVILHYGVNTHHQSEAIFKALGLSLKEAVKIENSLRTPSTKGEL